MPLYYPPPAGGSGDVATDSIWDAAGDLAVGSGSNTAARLAKGSAGQALKATAAGLAYVSHDIIIPRTTDSSGLTSQATPQNDDTLLFAVSGNSEDVWFVEAFLNFSAGTGGATMDVSIAWAVPANTDIRWGAGHVAGASFPGFYALAPGSTVQAALGSAGQLDMGLRDAANNFVHVSGWVYVGDTSGDVVLKWSQDTSNINNLVLRKGSHLRLVKLI